MPALEYSSGAPWVLLPIEALPPPGVPLEETVVQRIEALQLEDVVGSVRVGDHHALVVPGESIHVSVTKYGDGPLGEGPLPGLMMVLGGNEDSIELLWDAPTKWVRAASTVDLPSGRACLIDPVYPPLPASGKPERVFELPPGTYDVFAFQELDARAVWLQRSSPR